MTKLLVVGLTLLGMTACTSYSSLQPAAGTPVVYERGAPVMVSTGQASTVQLMPSHTEFETGERVSMWISVVNNADDAVDFDVTSVSASDASKTIKVIPYEQVVKEIRREAAWATVAQAMSAAGQSMQAANAGTSTSYTSGSARAYGSGGSAYGNYSSVTTTHDPAKARAAQAQVDANNRARMAEIAATQATSMEWAEQLLRRTTVPPGESLTGALLFDAPRGEPKVMRIRVVFGADTHEFLWNYVSQ